VSDLLEDEVAAPVHEVLVDAPEEGQVLHCRLQVQQLKNGAII